MVRFNDRTNELATLRRKLLGDKETKGKKTLCFYTTYLIGQPITQHRRLFLYEVYESIQSRIRGKSFFFMFIIPDMELELERIVLVRTLNMTLFTQGYFSFISFFTSSSKGSNETFPKAWSKQRSTFFSQSARQIS